MKLDIGDWFVLGNMFLDLGAAISYASKRRWPETLVWCCYSFACIGMLIISLRSKS